MPSFNHLLMKTLTRSRITLPAESDKVTVDVPRGVTAAFFY
jgi:hypothetical protein